MNSRTKQLLSIAAVAVVFFGFGILAFFLAPEESRATEAEGVVTVSAADHRLYYVKDRTEVSVEGRLVQVYSTYTNGKDEKAEDTFAVGEWEALAHADGVYESDGEYIGERQSPDGQHSVAYVPQRPFMPFLNGKHLRIQRKGEEAFELPFAPYELEWFPDSRRIAFAHDDSVYILDTQTREYAKVTDAIGLMVVQ